MLSIAAADEIERETIEQTIAWVDSGVELCRIEKPSTPPRHLVSYFALIDGDYILLVDHINAELWLPTGGHVEPGEHPRSAVLREVKEELNIDGVFLHDQPVFLTATETVGKTAGHTDVSIWYTLRGDRSQEIDFDEIEFHSIRWFHKDDVPLERSDRHMGRFLTKLFDKQFITNNSRPT